MVSLKAVICACDDGGAIANEVVGVVNAIRPTSASVRATVGLPAEKSKAVIGVLLGLRDGVEGKLSAR